MRLLNGHPPAASEVQEAAEKRDALFEEFWSTVVEVARVQSGIVLREYARAERQRRRSKGAE